MSDDYSLERQYVFTTTLENGEYLFKTEYGSLITETMLKEQLLNQFAIVQRRLTKPIGTQRLRITMEVLEVEHDTVH